MTLVTEDGQLVCFVQVAGLVARRILCYRMVGDTVKKGERYGFIRFGSRVDVYLPLSAQVLVSIGEKTTGVETVIARLGEPVENAVPETVEAEPAAETSAQAEPAPAEAAAEDKPVEPAASEPKNA